MNPIRWLFVLPLLSGCTERACPTSLQGLTATTVCLASSVGLGAYDGDDECADMPILRGTNQCGQTLTFPDRGSSARLVVAPDEPYEWVIDRQFEREEPGGRRFEFPVQVGAESASVSFVLR